MNVAEYQAATASTRERRMKWWHEARFGMFLHWGPYALIGRNEWAMNIEAWSRRDYEAIAARWKPKAGFADEWARQAVKSGMRYMVLTTRHLDGFCLWDSRVTDYCAGRMGPKRDPVAEYVAACRRHGLKVGFYFSSVDWHFLPSTQQGITATAARAAVDYAKGLLRELMSNYGRVDILWYDAGLPFAHAQEYAVELGSMARQLQPGLIINDRGMLAEDFSTPEDSLPNAGAMKRAWEACMTFNHTSWGYMPSAAPDSHSARDIVKMLYTCALDGGNLLLNLGPAPDGSLPPEAIEPLNAVGRWLKAYRAPIFSGDMRRCPLRASSISVCNWLAESGRNTLYLWVKNWPGREMPLGGFKTRLRKAAFVAGGKPIAFEQNRHRVVLKGLPRTSPDRAVGITLIRLDFTGKPEISENSSWYLRSDT